MKIQNQRTAGSGYFKPPFKEPLGSWNNRQRTSDFLDGYLTFSQIKKPRIYISELG